MIASIKNRLSQKLGEQEGICLLPGEYFYCQNLELPSGISKHEILQTAEFELEDLSPFPLESLAWGFYHQDGAPSILLYGASKERLKKEGFENFEGAYHVLPSFIPLLGRTYAKPTLLFLLQGSSLSALFYAANDPSPVDVITVRLADKAIESYEAIFLARETLLEEHTPPPDCAIEPGVFIVKEPHIGRDHNIQFPLHHLKEPHQELHNPNTVTLPGDTDLIWQADIRNDDFIQLERKQRRTTHSLWRAIQGGTLAVLCLLLMQGGMIGGTYWLSQLKGQIAAQAPEIERIENHRDLMFKIETLSTSGLNPFGMLDYLNQQRPTSIYFTNARANNFKELSLQGNAANVAEVNEYAQKLRQSNFLEHVKEPQTESKGGRVKFTLELTFNDQLSQNLAEITSTTHNESN